MWGDVMGIGELRIGDQTWGNREGMPEMRNISDEEGIKAQHLRSRHDRAKHAGALRTPRFRQ